MPINFSVPKTINPYFFTCFLFLFQFLPFKRLTAQVRIEAPGIYKNAPASINFYGLGTLIEKIPYSRIKGSPFWKDEWQLATLYSGKGKLSTIPIKLNLASNEIHFLKDENEMVLDDDKISTIVFHPDKDVSKTAEVFIMNDDHMKLYDKKVKGFAQVVNSGTHRLLKYTLRKVNSADSLFGTQKKYFFTDEIYYFLWHNDQIERIKKLNKDQVTQYLPSSSKYSEWINENRIDFRKESDVVRFLNHYNAQQTKSAITNNQK